MCLNTIMDNQNRYNRIEAEKARKRRAMYYRLWNKGKKSNKGLSISELARRYKMGYERMRQHIRLAERDVNGR
jgi:hypothetical protein